MNGIDWGTIYWLHALVTGVITLLLGAYLWRHRRVRTTRVLMLLMFAVSQWSITYALEFISPDLRAKLFWVRLEYIGGTWSAVLYFLMSASLVHLDAWFSRRRLILLGLIPVATVFLALTNDHHGLMWKVAWLDISGPAPMVAYLRGPGFWVFITYSYLIILSGLFLLLKSWLQSRGLYRRQMAVLLLGALIPLLSNLVYLAGASPISYLDLTPFSFMLTGLALAWALFRYRMLDLAPIAREAVMDGIGDGVLVLTLDDQIADLNPAGLGILGISPAEAKGKTLGQLIPELADLRANREADGGTTLKRGSQAYEVRVFPLHGRKKTLLGRLVLLRDVTGQRMMEEQLRHSQKMQAIGTLTGGIAHDFNNVLSAVMGYAELALHAANNNEPNSEEVGKILEAAHRAKDLIGKMMTFSRKADIDFKHLDLDREISAIIDILRGSVPKMIDIQTDFSPQAKFLLADAGQMQQMILNLGVNAADAMPQGGRLIFVTRVEELGEDAAQIHPEAGPGRYAVIRVSDTGQGMDEQTRLQIFEPFFTTKEIGKGTGLGLSTVFGIVRGHHGFVTCQSRVGRGTTFEIYLPLAPEEGRPAAPEAPSVPRDTRGRETVLLVDDEELLRDLGRRILEIGGYPTLVAASGEQALEIFRDNAGRIDLVVLDLGMPGMGGKACLGELLALDPTARVLVASGYARADLFQETLDLGAKGYVKKTYHTEELLAAVRRALDG